MTVLHADGYWTVSAPPSEAMILLRPGGIFDAIAPAMQASDQIEMLAQEGSGILIKIPAKVGDLLFRAEAGHPADKALLHLL